jgi:transposase-like protein
MCPFSKSSTCRIQRKGFFPKRSTRASLIQRYRCLDCRRSFSDQTGRLNYRHRLPHFDQPVFRILAGGVSQRKCAEFLGIHRNTVARKLVRLARFADGQEVPGEAEVKAATRMAVFDEMETFEHSKMKPLSITVAVTEKSRLILATKVASMPAKGLLAERSRKKYGKRRDDRREAVTKVLSQVKAALPELATLKSDECPRYPGLVQRVLPEVEHRRLAGRRGCVVGQGELKRGGFDPLFSLNHSCAMIRDNVKRLSRRTWCTTKRPDRLQALLELYRVAHNSRILHPKRKAMVRSGPIF